MKNNKHNGHTLSAAGLLVTLGIIYGDIGTSPLYVMNAVVQNRFIDDTLILGALSCVFWTLTLQTTFKYVILTLRADNNGEGGVFALFALIRRRNPMLIWPAMFGGAMLLADGVITPPISISSAVEGLRIYNPDIHTIPIVIFILVLLFLIQGLGTKVMGNAFGPIMLIWFLMLGTLGIYQIAGHWQIFQAINPYYGYVLLSKYPGGFWLLGAIFLCTTGAESLYSDLGHCGKTNIRILWVFVKSCLLLNYFGQGAWLLYESGGYLNGRHTFFSVMPPWFLPVGITIATLAAIIASQALISGSFTMISEAIRLNLWPKVKISFPTLLKGQLYVPSINWLLLLGCIGIVLYFEEATNMEAAYGLAINITMIVTTIMLSFYLYFVRKVTFFWVAFLFSLFMGIELTFLVGNLLKFTHGGYVTLIVSGFLFMVMYMMFYARKIKNRHTEFVKLNEYFPLLKELSNDLSIPKYATHLVYLTSANNTLDVESKIIYSIFQKQPKRADIYWFIHIDVTDDPYTMEYKVKFLVTNDVIRVDFRLGFRVEQRINLFFRKVVEDLVANKEVDFTSRYTSLNKRNVIGDFRFVVLEKHLSHDNDLPIMERLVMNGYFLLKTVSLSERSAFGLDTSSVTVEKVPLIITPMESFELKRID